MKLHALPLTVQGSSAILCLCTFVLLCRFENFPSLPPARLLLVTMAAAATAGTIPTPHWVGGAAAALAAAAAAAAPVAGKA